MFFSKFDINKVEWLKLVFENRNQSYGAYELRLKSSIYLRNALLISIFGFSSLFVIPAILNNLKGQSAIAPAEKVPLDDDQKLYQVIDIELPAKKQEVLPQEKAGAKSDFKQINFAPPKAVNTDIAVDAPTIDEISKAVIGTENIEGKESSGINSAGVVDGGNGIALDGTAKGGEGNNEAVFFADVMPEFPGGMAAWNKFLSKNLNYPAVARENGVQGRVTVSFVVEKNGEITALKIVRGIGAGCDEEALRVIRKSPFWKPGYQNGKAVRVAYVIPIVFRLD